MNEKESKAKYYWGGTDRSVTHKTTNQNGEVWDWVISDSNEIAINEEMGEWDFKEWLGIMPAQGNLTQDEPYAGDWRDSLEQRPHKCATCDNFLDDTCCHSTTQNDFEAMDAKHCSPLCKQSGATIPNFVCAVLILLGLIICMAINAQVGAV